MDYSSLINANKVKLPLTCDRLSYLEQDSSSIFYGRGIPPLLVVDMMSTLNLRTTPLSESFRSTVAPVNSLVVLFSYFGESTKPNGLTLTRIRLLTTFWALRNIHIDELVYGALLDVPEEKYTTETGFLSLDVVKKLIDRDESVLDFIQDVYIRRK